MATKVSKNLITSVDPSQLTTTGATAGQVLTYNASTTTWVASAAPGGTIVPGGSLVAAVHFNGYRNTSNVVDGGFSSTVSTDRLLRVSHNVTRVQRMGAAGYYKVFFTNAISDANYLAYCNSTYGTEAGGVANLICYSNQDNTFAYAAPTTTSFTFCMCNNATMQLNFMMHNMYMLCSIGN